MSTISINEEKRAIIINESSSNVNSFKYCIKFEELIGYRYEQSDDCVLRHIIKYIFTTKYGDIEVTYIEDRYSSLTHEKRINTLLNEILDERIENQFA